jgi:2-phospho-L-lactate guanylyltransferase
MWVVLPVKAFDKSKQRLAQVLNADQRQRLAEAMLKDVLQVLSNTKAIGHILVVTANKQIAELAHHYHAEVLMEPEDCSGLNEAVLLGVHYAELNGGSRALILHSDIPLVNSKDLNFLINTHLEGSVTLVPDKDEQGTNGFMLNLPTKIPFQYGVGSFQKHLNACRDLGYVCDIADLADLSLDIDSPEDLLELSLRLIDKPESYTGECLRQVDMQQAIIDIRRA